MDDRQFTEKCQAAIVSLAEDLYGDDVPVLAVLILSTPDTDNDGSPIDVVTFGKVPEPAADPIQMQAAYASMVHMACAHIPLPPAPIIVPLNQNQ